ncbi:MAG: ABC transporter substrate-binding protein [Bryobacterales bacterium]|nr:ABC transporter substrate-binding protein [Bryobacterales bacterium]
MPNPFRTHHAAIRHAACFLLAAAVCAAAPVRVVSTAPSFTESMYALGAGRRLVAVSNYCHYPQEAAKLPRIGSYLEPNIEAIARLRPDLVLLHEQLLSARERFAALGIPVLALRNTTLEETLTSIQRIGDALGLAADGARTVRELRTRLRAIETRQRGKPRRTLLFLVGRTPGRLDGMVAVGGGSYLNELIRIAGGRNVLGDSKVSYPSLSLEGVIRLNPDVIADMGEMSQTNGVTEAQKRAVVGMWEGHKAIRAVTQHTVFAVADDIFVVPGPRVVDAAEAFAAMLNKAPAR